MSFSLLYCIVPTAFTELLRPVLKLIEYGLRNKGIPLKSAAKSLPLFLCSEREHRESIQESTYALKYEKWKGEVPKRVLK